MRGDRLDVGELALKPAGILNGPAREAQHVLGTQLRGIAWIQARQDAAVVADQPLGHLRLALADLIQLSLRELRDRRHPLAEHLGEVVSRARARDVDHACQQRRALGRRDVAHHAGVGGHRLAGEVRDLRLRNRVQPRVRVAQGVDPAQVRDLLTKRRPRRAPRHLLEPVKRTLARGPANLEQLVEGDAVAQRDPAADTFEHHRVDLAADAARDLVERRERRKLQRRLDEHLQRNVDQVRRMVLHQRPRTDRV